MFPSHRSLIFNYGAIILGWILWSLNFLSFFLFQARFYRALAAAWRSENMSLAPCLAPKRGAVWVQVTTGATVGWAGGIARQSARHPAHHLVLCARITHSALLLLLVLLLIYGFFCILLFMIVPTSMCAIIFSVPYSFSVFCCFRGYLSMFKYSEKQSQVPGYLKWRPAILSLPFHMVKQRLGSSRHQTAFSSFEFLPSSFIWLAILFYWVRSFSLLRFKKYSTPFFCSF